MKNAVLMLALSSAFGQILPVVDLPGWSGSQKMYAGYVTVNATAGRALYLWYVESSGNPTTDPVVLWMNGGPGCSSLGGGLFEGTDLLMSLNSPV